MTNYDMLRSRDAVVAELGEEFARQWYDVRAQKWKRDAFGRGSNSNLEFFADARKMHKIWAEYWKNSKNGDWDFYNHITFDFGWWLWKDADIALLIPLGSYVALPDGKMGAVSNYGVSGYSYKFVAVECASGSSHADPKDLKRAYIPKSVMELAKAMVLKDLKTSCPILNEGMPNDGEEGRP